ncbi:T9SS type B sorting domain-containing protein [Paraflavitalea soli]|nr:gliding motility-associated C-terminal domain-containing protein [Paraflavitalea soli]
MKHTTLLFLLVCCYFLVSGQKETSQWFLYNGNRLQFNAGGPVNVAGSTMLSGSAGRTSLCDAQGNLLFVCDGMTVRDRNLAIMPAFANNVNLQVGGETVLAIQFPGQASKYYLFYSENGGNAVCKLRYSVIDMTLNGGKGDVTAKNVEVANDVSSGFTLVEQPGSDNFWIVTNEYRTTNFRSYLVTAAGISSTPVISVAGTNPITAEYNITDLRTSPDGKMIAGYFFTYYPNQLFVSSVAFIEVFNFDGNTGLLTNKVKSTKLNWVYSGQGNVEFSPDGRLLYLLEKHIVGGLQPCGFGSSSLRQFNLCYTDSVTFTTNAVNVGSTFSFCTLVSLGRMQLGPDKKIYMPYGGSTALSVVDSPNIIGSTGRMAFDAFQMPQGAGYASPAFFHQYLARAVRNNITYTGDCHPNPISFKVTNDTIHGITWNFGDPGSGGNNSSTQLAPQHVFSAPGIYTVTAQLYNTLNQLIETVNVPVEVKDPLRRLLADYPTDTSFCSGNELKIKLRVINGIFRWSKKDPGYPVYSLSISDSMSIVGSGRYYVELLQNDCNGCKRIDSIDVEVLPTPYVDFGTDRTLCTGDSTLLYMQNSGATYVWNTGETTPTLWIKQPGTYWGKAEFNNNGCPKSDTIVITGIPGVAFSLPADTTLCNDAQLVLKPGVSGATYQWQNGSTADQFVVQQPGKYWVRVTASNGCFKPDTIAVAYVTAQNVQLGADTILCRGETLLLQANIAGGQYLWSTGGVADNISVTTSGNYWVAVTTGLCTVKDTIGVTFNNKPVFDLGNDSSLCDGTTLVLRPGITNATYQWQDNSVADSFLVKQPGLYKVTVKQAGCAVDDEVRFTYKPLPVLYLGNDTSICLNAQLTVDATHASIGSYLWQDGLTTATRTINRAGDYSLQATGTNGCINRDTLRVSMVPLPAFSLPRDTALCEGQTLQLTGTVPGAANYLWNNGSTQPQQLINAPGTYWIAVTQQGCSKTDTIAVTYKPLPIVNLGKDTMLCPGATLVLDGYYPGATYQWQDQSTQASLLVSRPGQYVVNTMLNGCSSGDAINITYGAVPVITLDTDPVICAGQVLVLDPKVEQAQTLWPDGSHTPTFVVKAPGTYAVSATNVCGTATRVVNVHKGYCRLAMPTAFTPNKDHQNDVFRVSNPFFIKEFYMAVYNRWGQKVFETNNATVGWDGRFNGVDQPTGTYIWVIRLTDNDGVKASEKGSVQLLR